MKTQTDRGVHNLALPNNTIEPQAARDYITEMLAELSVVAKKSGHEDLHSLLKLTAQAASNSMS